MPASQSPPPSTIMDAGPRPSQRYLERSEVTAVRFDDTKFPLLVILDLNGCLVVRRGAEIELRGHVKAFLEYLLQEHYVMIWSSATATNVQRMVNALLTQEQQANLVAVWHRGHFDLTMEQYNSKIQLYKEIDCVWNGDHIQQQYPYTGLHPWAYWNFYNTVLIDDSYEKAKYQPNNHIHVPELLHSEDPNKPFLPLVEGTTVLSQVAGYLDWLKHSCNVANSIKNEPFQLNNGYNLNWQEFWTNLGKFVFVWDSDEVSGDDEVCDSDEDMEDRPPSDD